MSASAWTFSYTILISPQFFVEIPVKDALPPAGVAPDTFSKSMPAMWALLR
jgi:hypothetical protein